MKPPFFTNPYHILILSFMLLVISYLLKIYLLYKKFKDIEIEKKIIKLILYLHIISLTLLSSHFLLNNYYVNFNINNYNQNILKFFQTIFILLPSVYYFNRKYINLTDIVI